MKNIYTSVTVAMIVAIMLFVGAPMVFGVQYGFGAVLAAFALVTAMPVVAVAAVAKSEAHQSEG